MNLLSESVRDLLSADFSQLSLDPISGHYLLIDIGANLTNRKYAKDLDDVLQRARDVGNDFQLGLHLGNCLQTYQLVRRCMQNTCHRHFGEQQ